MWVWLVRLVFLWHGRWVFNSLYVTARVRWSLAGCIGPEISCEILQDQKYHIFQDRQLAIAISHSFNLGRCDTQKVKLYVVCVCACMLACVRHSSGVARSQTTPGHCTHLFYVAFFFWLGGGSRERAEGMLL